jgi:hypothetical protein
VVVETLLWGVPPVCHPAGYACMAHGVRVGGLVGWWVGGWVGGWGEGWRGHERI